MLTGSLPCLKNMYVPEFSIPLNREDLMRESENGQLFVKVLVQPKELNDRLEAAKLEFSEQGVAFILDHFSTFYSVCLHFGQISELNRQKAWSILTKTVKELVISLRTALDDVSNIDLDEKNNMRNITKIIVYITIEMMSLFQDRHIERSFFLVESKNKKKAKSLDESNWTRERLEMFSDIHALLHLPIKMLWDPPVVDEEFINLISSFCYKCLEDISINNMNMKLDRDLIFEILALLVKNYIHGLSFAVKVVQLLKTSENYVNTLTKGVVQMVQEHNCKNIVQEIIREISETDGDQLAVDTTGTRSLNQFLVQLAESLPELVMAGIKLLISHLSGDCYQMRMCVLQVLGVMLTALAKEDLMDDMKEKRDEFLDYLEEHICDANAFVRSKALQIWQKLCSKKAVPVSRINKLLALSIDRLKDRSTYVKKEAIHLIKILLETNPFSAQLNTKEIEIQLKEETSKLLALKKAYELRDFDTEWKIVGSALKEQLEEKHEKDNGEKDEGAEWKDGELDLQYKIEEVGKYLLSGDYAKSVKLFLSLKDKCHEMFDLENEDIEPLILLQTIFQQRLNSSMVNVPVEVQEKLEKLKMTIDYLENAHKFARLIDKALAIILNLLDNSVTTVVLESNHFFTAAYLFGFLQALEGIRKMLYLMYSKEDVIRSAVCEAYKKIYFDRNLQGRPSAIATIKNLSNLILQLNESQLRALDLIVREWTKGEVIDSNFIQILFERFSKKVGNPSDDYSWAALNLIRMIATEEPRIIKSNVSVLLSQGLGKAQCQNFLIAKETCRALLRLIPEKRPGKFVDETLRYPLEHEIFVILYRFLRDSMWRTKDLYYIPFADEAINFVFHLCEKPDSFCERLIQEIHERITKSIDPLKKKNGKYGYTINHNTDLISTEDSEPNAEDLAMEEPTEEEINEKEVVLLTRFISILGQVAANYVLYLEGAILNELKRRNQMDFERRLKKCTDKKNRSLKGKKSVINSASGRLDKTEEGGEDLEFNRVAADDMDAEELKRNTEHEIVTGNGFLARYAPLLLVICKNHGKYNNLSLQNATLVTLSKYMLISTDFCEEHLQLLVTICEKSHIPEMRKNAIIALGSLQYRFPNTLEPWTPNMYGMLRDLDTTVRLTSVMVLTDLIVNEMIKVRSNILDLALVIVDKDPDISNAVRHFFKEYSLKGNSLFNLIPGLISNLILPETHLTEEEFKTIMTFILGLFTKDKHSEYLIDKLFQYFDSATEERQWKDLAFCLSQLNYNDKALKKMADNLRYFGSKLYVADVYESFCTIVANAGKNPQKDKALVKEIQDLMIEYREKSCRARNSGLLSNRITRHTEKGTGRKKAEIGYGKRSVRCKKKINYDDEEEYDENAALDDDDDDAFMSDSDLKRRYKSGNVKRIPAKNDELSAEEEYDSDECPKKQTKRKKNVSEVKKMKINYESPEMSSDEEDHSERKLRSTRKRK